ncbi:Serine/threonine-protein kinase PknD [Actinomadura sp. RB99]|uniref:protein kinase domain-containing protein n=1 Tax=Actinomadura sp. RB99 TaxID=2691577 RepID=UPI001684F88E|nr:Serine/threonine-protein kinase PknD [Actinomadura sp. RB99]
MREGDVVADRYRLVRTLVGGATGEVWLARDAVLGRDVVVKRPGPKYAGRAGAALLRAEARALAKFEHPHVVTLYDAVFTGPAEDPESWLVMAYVPGGGLAGGTPLPPWEAARLCVQVAGALEALHAKGIVHCDIKPGNILLDHDGTAKLADFGAAYRLHGSGTITPNGPLFYTPGYAAPEVLLGAPEPASDVYSLGVTLHALITGRSPGRGGAVRRRGALARETGPLRALVKRMLHPNPAERPSLAEVRTGLEPPCETRIDAGPVRRRGRRALTLVAVAPVPVLALAAVIFLWQPGILWEPGGTPRASIGDQRSADPCALADPGVVARFGTTKLDPYYGDFDRCDVTVQPPNQEQVDVELQLLGVADDAPAGPVRDLHGFRVVAEAQEGQECHREIRLPAIGGGGTVDVSVTQRPPRAPLCAIADAAVEHATGVLRRGPLARRRLRRPGDSLIRRDACTLLGASALRTSLGSAPTPKPRFGHWGCDWSGAGRLGVRLLFDQGDPQDGRGGRPIRLAGRPAFVWPDEGDGCETDVVHRTFWVHGNQKVESLNLTVTGDVPGAERCARSARLAEAAAKAVQAQRPRG